MPTRSSTHGRRLLIVVIRVLLTLSSLEPFEELLGVLADLLAGCDINVLLAGLVTPSLENLLGDKVVLVVLDEDTRDLVGHVWVLETNETLSTTEQGLFMTFRSNHTLEHGSTGVDLLDHVLVKESLGKHSEGPVLGLDVEFLGLEVDVDILNLGDATLFFSLAQNPFSELVVRVGAFAITIFVLLVESSTLEIGWELLHTSLDSFLRDINSPLNLLLFFRLIEFLGFGVDALEKFISVITVAVLGIAIVVLLVTAFSWTTFSTSSSALCFLSSLAVGLLGRLVLLALDRGVLQDERRQLLAKVDIGTLATSLAVEHNVTVLDMDNGFWVLAVLAQNESVDETIEVVLKLGGLVGTVDDPAVILGVNVGLGTQFETKVLDQVGRRTSELVGDIGQVDNDSLDTVAFALDLGLKALHLVAVEGVGDILDNRSALGLRVLWIVATHPANVDVGHGGGSEVLTTLFMVC